MSQQLINRSPDLHRLRDEGYKIDVVGGYLLVRQVPYVDSSCTVKFGTLVCQLNLSGDKTNKPATHVAFWSGEHPCHANGSKITSIENQSRTRDLGNGIHVDHRFSAKADYRDYYHKVTTYIGRISGEASMIDPSATAQDFTVILNDSESVLKYVDTATSRADIGEISQKLANLRIGIVGLGGTGSYVLDLVAKTWVSEIHLFDGDIFSQHNAFRAPSAPTLEQLEAKPKKVSYYKDLYSNMRHGIIAHGEYLDESNLNLLGDLDFVFLCIDGGGTKHEIVDYMVANKIAFVETGMGIFTQDSKIGGMVRTVLSTPENYQLSYPHISFDASSSNEYATNIQIADLNALNAFMAVIKWKKYCGMYAGLGNEYYSGYSIFTEEMAIERDSQTG